MNQELSGRTYFNKLMNQAICEDVVYSLADQAILDSMQAVQEQEEEQKEHQSELERLDSLVAKECEKEPNRKLGSWIRGNAQRRKFLYELIGAAHGFGLSLNTLVNSPELIQDFKGDTRLYREHGSKSQAAI